MGTATKNTNAGDHNQHWTATATKSGTYEFNTAGKFVDRDIDLVIPQATETVSGSGSATVSSVTVGSTKNANSKYPVSGSGTISGTATATVGTKGFTDSNSYSGSLSGTATVSAELGAATLAASVDGISGTTIGSVTVGTKSGTSYPVTGSTTVTGTLHANVSTAGYATSADNKTGSLSQSVSLSGATIGAAAATVSGSATVKPNSLTAANGNAKIASAATTTQPTSGYYVAATPATATSTTISQSKSGLTQGYLGTLDEITATGSVTGGNGSKYYIPIQGAGVTKGTTTVGTTKGSDGNYPVTRGTFDISEGYISGTDGDLSAASFGNSASTGTTYVDISETSASPILVSGKGLYINKGYVDNLYISLAKLTPDGASAATAIQAGMLNSVSAYDSDGNLITGDIATKTQSDLSASGKTVTVPAGYYASQVTKDVASGSVNSYTIDETTQASKILTAGTASGGYYPISVPSLTGTVNRTAGYISGTTSTAADANGGVIGKIAASTVTGTGSDTKSTTLSFNSYKNTSNLASGTYRTSAATGYTYHIDADASVTATTASASRTVSAGYNSSASTASATASISADSKNGSVYLLDGVITNNTSGGTSTGTINPGAQIKIAKGYYPNDVYYTAQAESEKSPITGSLNTSIASGYTAPTLVDSPVSGTPYVTISGNGSMTTGHIYNGTANAKTQYMEVYAGTYSVS